MQQSDMAVSVETPKTRTSKSAPKRKSSSQKALMGHKWFKGSPKSRSNQRMSKKLLKSPPVEKTPQKPPTPVGVVEFDFDSISDRVSVFDSLPCEDIADCIFDFWCGFGTPGDEDEGAKRKVMPGSSAKLKLQDRFNKETPKGRSMGTKKEQEVAKKKQKTPNSVSRSANKSVTETDTRKKTPPLTRLPEACYDKIKDHKYIEAPPLPIGYIRYMEVPQEELADEVEYDLDGEDNAWLTYVNLKRQGQNLQPVKFSDMELLMDRLEKESYFQMQSTGIDQGALIDDDAVCCICMDGECQNSNAILFCDMCNLAVHQECYGVPYIPEGQWLCRRCLQSPSRAVDCALCPNKGGAFKQTDDGRWAHVVCAIWIPEVCFANTVFLEPVDSIGNIPPARWRLVCFICKQKGVGACIQCHKSNCYVAFHVTCAQQAGLCMKMDTVRESSSITVKKTAYCDNHAPPDSDFGKETDGNPSPRQKMRQARKLLAEKRSAVPVLSIPTIPDDRVAEIAQTVSFSRKTQFIKRLMAYWKLKRQSRNGVPLLRRLQAASTAPHPPARENAGVSDPEQTEEAQLYYRYWLRLRQDLERARLLCELVRKREKVKKELIHLKCREIEIRLRPFSMFLINVLDEIQAKDAQEIFAKPVDIEEVPDYLDVVQHPMDLSTIREKINSFEYNDIDDFEKDFNLMIENCLNYNSKDTVFYRQAVRLRELGGIIIRHARRSIQSIGFDSSTGLHLPERNHEPQLLTDDQIIDKVDNLWNDKSRFDLPFDKHLELLNEVLDYTLGLSHASTRKKKFLKIKHEIVRVRRLKHSKLSRLSSKSHLKAKYKRTENSCNILEKGDSHRHSDRPKNKLSRGRGKEHGESSVTGARCLRPPKRRREVTPPPQRLTSSRVLRRSTSRSNIVKSPPPKKPRRNSSSPAEVSSQIVAKGKGKTIDQNQTLETTKKTEGRKRRVSPAKDRDAGRRSDRESVPKTSPAKSTSPVSVSRSTNRRNTVLLTKKINATLEGASKNSPAKNNPVLPEKHSTVSSRKSVTPSKVAMANSGIESVSHRKTSPVQPNRRNLSRARKSINNNNVTLNNNVILDQWSQNINAVNGDGVTSSLKWNHGPKAVVNSACYSKSDFSGANHVISTTQTRRKKVNPSPTSHRLFTSQNLLLGSNPHSAAGNTSVGIHNSVRSGNVGNNARNAQAKSDSFSVYRSGKDVDLNSEDEDDDDEKKGPVNPNSEDESTGNENDSAEGESESDDDDSSSAGSASKKSSDTSDSEISYKSTRARQGSGQYDMRRTRIGDVNHGQASQNDRNKLRLSGDPDAEREEGLVQDGHFQLNMKIRLEPLDLVWAKCKEGSWYPALIINPDMPVGFTQNDVPIPGPPSEVLSRRPRHSKENYFLILCFDSKQTWEWISRSHLEPLGHDPKLDKGHLETRKSDKRALGAVRRAYEKAILHRRRVNGSVDGRLQSFPH